MNRTCEEQSGHVLHLAETLFAVPGDPLVPVRAEIIDDPSVAMEDLFGRCLARLAAAASAAVEADEVHRLPDAIPVGPPPDRANAPQAAAATTAHATVATLDVWSGESGAPRWRRRMAGPSAGTVAGLMSALAGEPAPARPADQAVGWPAGRLRARMPAPAGESSGAPAASGQSARDVPVRNMTPPATRTPGQADDALGTVHPGTQTGGRQAAGEAFSPRTRRWPETVRTPNVGDQGGADRPVAVPATQQKGDDDSFVISRLPPRATPAGRSLPAAPAQASPAAPAGDAQGGRSTRLLAGVGDLNHLFTAVLASQSASVGRARDGDRDQASGGAKRSGALARVPAAAGPPALAWRPVRSDAVDRSASRDPQQAGEPAAFSRPGATLAGVSDAVAEDLLFERLLERWEARLREQAMRQFGSTGGLV